MNTKRIFLGKLLDIFLHNNNLSSLSESQIVDIINKLYSLPDFKKLNILIISTQYPRYGGAATIAYEFHDYLLSNKINSSIMFIDRLIEDINFKTINPDNLKNVFYYNLPKNIKKFNFEKIRSDILNVTKTSIDLVFGFNYYAPYIGKLLFFNSIVFYMITGFRLINNNNLISVKDLLDINPINLEDKKDKIELKSIEYCDYIIPNSFLTKTLFEKYYSKYKYKIIDNLDLNDLFKKIDFKKSNEKEFDIGFICSNFTRNVKNINFVKDLFTDPRIKNLKKIIIGQNPEYIVNKNNEYNIFCAGFLSKETTLHYLSKIKILIVPSLIESYSLVAIEGYESGSVVLTSINTGISNFMDNYFILNNFEKDKWLNKINEILNNYRYFFNIFRITYHKSESVSRFFKNYKFQYTKNTILFVSIDYPNIGGAATNTYRIFNEFRKINHFNAVSLFLYDNVVNNKNKLNILKEIREDKDKYCIPWNDKSGYYVKRLRNTIYSKFGKVDIIFCKNYKVVNLMKSIFVNSKILFSPSGISSIQPLIKDNYIIDSSLENLKWDNIDEKKCFEISTNILCNSKITNNILKKLVGNHLTNRFISPINLSNIVYETKNTKKYIERKYDILFCCYNWKRYCKNKILTKEILELLNKDYKCILIGQEFENKEWFEKNSNITYFEYVSTDEMENILNEVKITTIPSFYDSSPNLLVECLMWGCQVITSANVGNYNTLPKENIVEKYQFTNEWIKCIKKIHRKINNKNGKNINNPEIFEDKYDITSKLSNIFRNILIDKKINNSLVSIYKIPAHVNDFTNFNFLNNKPELTLIEKNDESFIKMIFDFDIFFQITMKLANKYRVNETNYILFNEDNEENYKYNVNKYYPYLPTNTQIIVLNDIKFISHFKNANIYFLRGMYLNFYNRFIKSSSKSIFYPATSLQHKYKYDNSENLIKEDYSYNKRNKFKYVLVHEDPVYNLVFKNSKNILFKKFASSLFYFKNLKRIYDICFIYNTMQLTKNYELFIDLLKYFEKIGKKYSVLIIFFNGNERIDYKFKNLKVTIINELLSRELLCNYFNEVKINMIFSGRDAFPRVITESSYCGCYNIALDTLTDGKYFYDNSKLGVLISSPSSKKEIKGKNSLSYTADPILFDKIIPYIESSYNHQEISVLSKNEYDIEKLIAKL
jgi:hypothetical protein